MAATVPRFDDVYKNAQRRILDQETFFSRGLSRPLMKNTYLFDNYAYGWIPETAIWSSRYANLDASDYYPISLGLLKKFEFLMSLYKGPIPVYEEKVNTEFIANGSFSGRYVSYLRKFSSLPTNEFISFLLLTSIPIYNILFWFKTHSLILPNTHYSDTSIQIMPNTWRWLGICIKQETISLCLVVSKRITYLPVPFQ